jgi:biopolymer transport protein TolQ
VIGYNQFTARLREFAARMDDFARELLNAIENAAMMPGDMAPPPQPLRRDLRHDTDLDPRLR